MKFSANLGFLWNELELPAAIRAAKAAGFDAVECHWPYNVPAKEVTKALQETGLKMLGINTRRGDAVKGDNGLSAIPERIVEARAAIDEAVNYAAQISAQCIHVMAGFASGPEADKTFKQVWQYGKNRGVELFSTIVSDVDYLPKTKNILMTSGFVSPKDNHRAKVVEVSTKDNTEVFEATIFFKSTNKGSKPGWGQTDVLYRSERMELKN